jgi:probable HAF family extracellular repeat protein
MTMISDTYGWAAGINDNGEVTGVFTPPGLLQQHAFAYQDGVLTDIGTLPGYSNMPYALPYAINNSGTIVGDSNATAFVYDNGTMSIVRRLSARAAYAVNDGGDVVGILETARGGASFDDHGFLFSNNSMIDIGTLDGDSNSKSVALGINRARQIVGVAWRDGNSEERAILWENGAFLELPLLKFLSRRGGSLSEVHLLQHARPRRRTPQRRLERPNQTRNERREALFGRFG